MLVAFDQYADWHPILALDAKPEHAVPGAELPARVSSPDAPDQHVILKVLTVAAPTQLTWEGGSLDAVLGRHSFTLKTLADGTTELTDTEEFYGPGAAEVVPDLDQLAADFARYGAALQARATS